MVSMVIWLVFLVIVIAAIVRNANRNTRRQNTGNRNHTDSSYHAQPRQAAQEKKGKPGPAEKMRGHQMNMERPRSTEKMREHQMNMKEIYDKNNIVAAAKANAREVELDNDFDASQAKLMEGVYDVMVKGPKDTMSFQRDFLAEGLDMLNSFQAGNSDISKNS